MSGITEAFKIEWPLLLAQMVNFLLLMAVLYAFLFRPVLNMMEKRKERIAQSMKDVERLSVVRSALSRLTKASLSPPQTLCAPLPTPGKSAALVWPAT